MRHMPSCLIAILLACSPLQAADPAPSSTAAPAYSVADFIKRPTYGTAKISPDGRYLAVTVDIGEQDVLTVLRTSDLRPLKVNQLPDKGSIGQFSWISPERLLFTSVRKLGGYAQPFQTGEWYAVNADGSQATPVIFRGTRDSTQRGKAVGMEQYSLLDTLPGDDRNVLMTVNYPRSAEGVGTEVVRVDTVTGRRTPLGRAPTSNCALSLDAEKQPRFAVCSSSRGEDGGYDERSSLYRRDGMQWTLLSSSAGDGHHLGIYATSEDGTVYATQDDGKAPAALGTLDPATGTFSPLFQDPQASIARAIWSTDGRRIIGVVTAAGAPRVTLLEEEHPDARLYASLAEAFPGQMVDFSSHTEDGRTLLVSVYSDSNPGELYLFDRDSGQARFLMSRLPHLDPARLATIRPFSFTTPDGLTVHALLTLPRDSGGRKLPLVVNPHGGPIGPSDSWGYNREAQLFASRGYATLQVNFRGSGGYGRAFQNAGHRQWGERIQDDILQATRWVIDQGLADPERICIYGGSFGGYSALMAPIRAPGLFRCAFGYVGVYDVEMLFSKGDIPQRESGLRYLRHTHGSDRAEWARNSPARRAGEVRIPVYLAAGARDTRAVPEQTELMHRALVEAGNPPEGRIIAPGEMHGFYGIQAQEKLYSEMLQFFDRHIGPQR